MKKTIWILTVLAAGAAVTAAVASRKQPAAVLAATPKQAAFIAAAGRVEPAGEEVRIGAEMDGKLARVAVDEGDEVRRGQVLAVLQNGEFLARRSRQATLRERKPNWSGSATARVEEKREVEALLREAEAQFTMARSERDRQTLLERGAISRAANSTSPRAMWRPPGRASTPSASGCRSYAHRPAPRI